MHFLFLQLYYKTRFNRVLRFLLYWLFFFFSLLLQNTSRSDASTGRLCRPGLPWPLGPGLPLPADTAPAQPSLPKNERPHKSQQQAGTGCIAAMGRNFCLSHDTLPFTARTAVSSHDGKRWRMGHDVFMWVWILLQLRIYTS